MTREVPTTEQLVEMGLATKVTRMVPIAPKRGARKPAKPRYRADNYFRISDEGHALVGEIMAERAAAAIARGEGDWVQPPGRPDIHR